MSTTAELVTQIRALLDQISVSAPPPPVSAPIATPAALDAALAAASPGAILWLAPTLVYPAPLELKTAVTLRPAALDAAVLPRMTATGALPTFQGGITVSGDGITLTGLEVRNRVVTQEIIIITGAHVTLDRVRVLGDPTLGAHRGIRANGANLKILRCYVDDIFTNGQDTQAILSWDTPGPMLIDDCYLCAAGETVMFGGADPSSALNIPSDITLSNSTLTKKLAWRTPSVLVKNALELKNCRRVLVKNNIVEYAWLSGQTGCLFMITPRNQSGTAPYSTVEDIEVVGNTFRHGSGAIVISGTDDEKPSKRTSRVNIHDNHFEEIDPMLWGRAADGTVQGTNKLIAIYNGPVDVTIDANTFTGANLGAQVYFDGVPMCVNFTLTNNHWPPSTYGIFGSNVAVGPRAAFEKFAPGGRLAGNVEGP